MKILTVIGARPQFIKAAAVSAAIADKAGKLTEVLVHTGQHFDYNMSKVFFEQMGIPEPKYNFDIHSLPHGAMTGMMLTRLEEVIPDEKPDMVMVYGDTNSTLAGALAARKLNIPVAHVEAGLRSFNMNMPEEINRILADRISSLLFCPTSNARKNLVDEGFLRFGCKIIVSGDVMLDAALRFQDKAVKPSGVFPGRFVLATIHRQSNTDNKENLISIIRSLEKIAGNIHVILPLHPRTQGVIRSYGISPDPDKITLLNPVGYLESLWLVKNSMLVLTDSGGLQKEAYFMGKNCITLRDETEWTELVDSGTNIPAGIRETGILEAFNKLLNKDFIPDLSIYGSGNASGLIADEILRGV